MEYACVLVCSIAFWTFLATLKVLWLSNQMREWEEVEAWIDTVSIKDPVGRYHASKSIECKYRYSHAGREYHGKTIALLLGDNVWKDEWYLRLRAKQERKQPIACYIDPTKPARAVLVRDLNGVRLLNDLLIIVVCSGYVVGWRMLIRRRNRRNLEAIPKPV